MYNSFLKKKKKLLSDPTWPFCKSPDHICLHKSKNQKAHELWKQ